MEREAKIKKLQLKEPMYYLWFIGVNPEEQNKRIGSVLLTEVINEGISKQRTICLETSTLKNIPWYEKFGFKIYNELDLGYKLFFLKKDK
jgi:ribosomal protein S18 acetylase RimI-like enzyme